MPETAPAAGPTRATSARPRSYLALDLGTRRTGVAVGNTLLERAQPLRTLRVQGAELVQQVRVLVQEWQPDALVVGVPRHPDGAAHDHTRRAERFMRQLQAQVGLPVHGVDERYTTVEALAQGAPDPDSAAAARILEQFLRNLPAHADA